MFRRLIAALTAFFVVGNWSKYLFGRKRLPTPGLVYKKKFGQEIEASP